MNVKSVNSVAFVGTQKTASGNDYKKCKTGKIAGFVYGATCAVVGLNIANVRLAAAKTIAPESLKKPIRAGKCIFVVVAIGLWTGIGAIIDGAINRHRRNHADERAVREKQLEQKLEQKFEKEIDKKVQEKIGNLNVEKSN